MITSEMHSIYSFFLKTIATLQLLSDIFHICSFGIHREHDVTCLVNVCSGELGIGIKMLLDHLYIPPSMYVSNVNNGHFNNTCKCESNRPLKFC